MVKANPIYETFYRVVLGSWLLMMIVFSGDFASVKIFFMLILLGLTLIELTQIKFSYNLRIWCSIFIWLAFCLASYLNGMINGFDFSFNLFFYFILTPVLCFILASVIDDSRFIFISKVLVLSLLCIYCLSFLYIGFRLGLYHIPQSIVSLNAFGGTKITDAQLEVRLSSQSSLIFLLPYISVFMFIGSKRFFYSLLLFLGFIVVLFSGRRALQILFFFGIMISFYIYVRRDNLSTKRVSLILFYAIGALFFMGVALEVVSYYAELKSPLTTFINTVLLSFDSTEGGGIQRHIQSVSLLEYFLSSPLWGHGLNSHTDYIRNLDEPWSYEWVYLALLAQNGLFFFALFLIFLVCILKALLKKSSIVNDSDVSVVLIAIFCGAVCFLIGGASNPMVYFSWFWFLCFICMNGKLSIRTRS